MANITCSTGFANITNTGCEANYGQVVGVWLDEDSAGVTYANALLEATWTTKINAARGARMFVINPTRAIDATRDFEDDVFLEGNTALRKKVRDGKIKFTFEYVGLTLCQANNLKTFDGGDLYAYFITANDVIMGGDSGTNLTPVQVETFVSNPIPQENSDDEWRVKFYVDIIPTKDYFKYAASAIDAAVPWNPSQTVGIKDLTLAEVSSSTSQVVVSVTGTCNIADLITDLSTTADQDFIIKDSTGATVSQSSITRSGNEYTILATLTTGTYTITLVNQPGMTTKGYEASNTLTFTT